MNINITYDYEGCLPPCSPGQIELVVGDFVKIPIDPKNPEWPEHIIAEVTNVERTPSGRIYTFSFDDSLLNGGPVIEGCDMGPVEPYCCCEENSDRISTLEDCVFKTHQRVTFTALESSGFATFVVEKNGVTKDVRIDFPPYTVGDSFSIAEGWVLDEANSTQPIPNLIDWTVETIVEGCVEGSVFPREDNSDFNITDNGNGTATTSNGICLKTCDAPDASIAHVFKAEDWNGSNVIADADLPTAFDQENGDVAVVEFQNGYTVTYTSDGAGTWAIGAVIEQPNTSTLQVISDPDGSQTVIHNGSADPGGTTTFTIPAPVTDTDSASVFGLVNNPDGSVTITHDPGDGSGPTVSTIPAPSVGAISIVTQATNPDGSTTYTHNDGNGGVPVSWTTQPADTDSLTDNNDGTYTGTGGIASVDTRVSATKSVDPAEACSDRVALTSPNHTPQNIDGVGRTNTFTGASIPSNTAGTYVEHNVRGENDGVEQDVIGARTLPTDVNQRVLIEETKTGCSRSSTVHVENFVGKTLFVDGEFGNDATALPYRRDKPYKTIAAAESARLSGENIRVINNTYTNVTFTSAKGGGYQFDAGVLLSTTGDGNNFIVDADSRFTFLGSPNVTGGLWSFRSLGNDVTVELGSLVGGRTRLGLNSTGGGDIKASFNHIENTNTNAGGGLIFSGEGSIEAEGGNIEITGNEFDDACIKSTAMVENNAKIKAGDLIANGYGSGIYIASGADLLSNVAIEVRDINATANVATFFAKNHELQLRFRKGIGQKGLLFGGNSFDAKVEFTRLEANGSTSTIDDSSSDFAMVLDSNAIVYCRGDRVYQSNVNGAPALFFNNNAFLTMNGTVIENANPTVPLISINSSNCEATFIGCSLKTGYTTIIDATTAQTINVHLRDTYMNKPIGTQAMVMSGVVNIAPNLPAIN